MGSTVLRSDHAAQWAQAGHGPRRCAYIIKLPKAERELPASMRRSDGAAHSDDEGAAQGMTLEGDHCAPRSDGLTLQKHFTERS
jgi:hypothetical protein